MGDVNTIGRHARSGLRVFPGHLRRSQRTRGTAKDIVAVTATPCQGRVAPSCSTQSGSTVSITTRRPSRRSGIVTCPRSAWVLPGRKTNPRDCTSDAGAPQAHRKLAEWVGPDNQKTGVQAISWCYSGHFPWAATGHLHQVALARTNLGIDVAGAATTGYSRRSHCWASQPLQS